MQPPADGTPIIPLDRIRDKRFAYNSLDSMSGIIAPSRDLEAMGESLDIFSRAHRDRRASRFDRRRGRGQGGCLRDRLPLLAHGQAPRAEGRRAARSSAGPACARACR